jgi:hypothetical protein
VSNVHVQGTEDESSSAPAKTRSPSSLRSLRPIAPPIRRRQVRHRRWDDAGDLTFSIKRAVVRVDRNPL